MHIAIVGGGIGGLTTAVALAGRGLEVDVFEGAPELSEVGAGLWVPTNALQVLGDLGLADEVAAEGLELSRVELHDWRAGRLDTLDLGPIVDRFGYGTVSIHRARLQQVLAAAVPEGRLHLGRRLERLEQAGDGVTLHFAGDVEPVQADLVVGADGLRSTVRAHLFPDAALRDSGQTCYRSVAPLALPPEEHPICRETWAPGRRFGFSALGPKEVYWFAPIDAVETDPNMSPEGVLTFLRERYASFAAPIPAILEATDPTAVIRTDLHDLAPLGSWHRGRAVLIGDAAHATTPNLGQGGAQAIEDAGALAACLAEADHETAFRRFESLRRKKALWVVKTSRDLGRIGHARNPVVRALRNLALRTTPDFVRRRQMDVLYSVEPTTRAHTSRPSPTIPSASRVG